MTSDGACRFAKIGAHGDYLNSCALSNLDFGVAQNVVFRSLRSHKEVPSVQKVYRATHGQGTYSL
jgi:hypothetical protein